MDTRLPQEHRVPSQCFDFMKLQRELRDMVYSFALAQPDPISLRVQREPLQNNSDPSALPEPISGAPAGIESGTSSSSSLAENSRDRVATRGNLNLAVLRVSKTVYNEARLVFYGSNTFIISVRDALQTLRLLSASRNLVRHLGFEFSNWQELWNRFPYVAQYRLRYFRGLRDLMLIFPKDHSKKDWELLGQDILSGEPSPSFHLAAGRLARAVDWVPINTEITVVGANFDLSIGRRRLEGAKDQKVETAVRSMIQS